MALTRLFVHDTFYDATDNFTYTPGMRLTLDNTTQSARITRLQNSGVVSTDETIDTSGVTITGGNIDGTVIGATTAAAGTFTTITVDTTTLVTDAANNRVGIGTASPSQALDVSGIVQATRFYIDDGNAVIERDSGALNVQTFAGNHIVLQPGGNVGIGTTSPSSVLHVNGSTGLRVSGADTNAVNTLNIYQTANVASNSTRFHHVQNDGNIMFRAASTGGDQLVLTASGNVGIGTTSPAAKLHVYEPNTTAVSLTWGASAGQIFRNENSEFAFGLSNASPFPLYIQGRTSTNTARNIALQPLGGNIGIGATLPEVRVQITGVSSTAPALGTASGSLYVTGADTAYGLLAGVDAGSGSAWLQTQRTDATGTAYHLWLQPSGGNVGIGITAPLAKLHVRDDSATPFAVQREADGQFIDLDANGYSGHHTLDGTAYFIGHNSGSRGLSLQTASTTRLFIQGGGNVGINETAPDYGLDVNGTFGFTPGTSVTPVDNGDVVFEATNNTTFTVKLKGTDGTVRSGTLTLA